MEGKFVWFLGVDAKFFTCSHLLVKDGLQQQYGDE